MGFIHNTHPEYTKVATHCILMLSPHAFLFSSFLSLILIFYSLGIFASVSTLARSPLFFAVSAMQHLPQWDFTELAVRRPYCSQRNTSCCRFFDENYRRKVFTFVPLFTRRVLRAQKQLCRHILTSQWKGDRSSKSGGSMAILQ